MTALPCQLPPELPLQMCLGGAQVPSANVSATLVETS